jgi:hypothetical protein
VFEADVRDDRNGWLDDVGRVEPAPEPHFEDRDVAPGVAKGLEREQRRVFEEGERRQTRVGAQLVDAARCLSLGNGTPPDAHTLDVSLQVGRRELSGLVPGGPQHGLDHRRDAALPVGPCDVNEAHRALRMATQGGGFSDAVEPELDAA